MHGITAAFEGRMGQDGELRFTASGTPLWETSVAVDQKPRQGQGQGQGEKAPAQWVRVVVWGERAEALAQEERLTKGTSVYIEGKLELRAWQDREGRERSTLQVAAFLVQSLGQIGRRASAGSTGQPVGAPAPRHPQPDADDGLPF
ncbi:MAG: single-stranded DNA-binding protein [Chloroflexi bacterium]|nr:single-stranded DNA-binding protein [Chloroflexota bacterium]